MSRSHNRTVFAWEKATSTVLSWAADRVALKAVARQATAAVLVDAVLQSARASGRMRLNRLARGWP